VKRIGILYHPRREKARDLSEKLEEFLSSRGFSSWRCSAWDEDKAKSQVASTELILSIGGDGTILHSARIVTPLSVPILGINLGRLGFITEIDGNEILSNLPDLLNGKGWIEERAMLEAQVEDKNFHALNDVVLRSLAVRLVNIEAEVDGTAITTYRADGVIAAWYSDNHLPGRWCNCGHSYWEHQLFIGIWRANSSSSIQGNRPPTNILPPGIKSCPDTASTEHS